MRRSIVLLFLFTILAVPGAGQSALAEGDGPEISACASEAESTLAVLDCVPASEQAREDGGDARQGVQRRLEATGTTSRFRRGAGSRPRSSSTRAATGSAPPRSSRPMRFCAPRSFSRFRRSRRTRPHFRVLQDDLVRAVSPQIHPVAEIHVTGWQGWVTANKKTWYEAGVEARKRMAAAGYIVENGEIWAVNEFSSAVRRGDGNARANMRAFVRGLTTARPGCRRSVAPSSWSGSTSGLLTPPSTRRR